jgi:hypothetical protein
MEKYCYGKTLMRTFIDSVPLTKEVEMAEAELPEISPLLIVNVPLYTYTPPLKEGYLDEGGGEKRLETLEGLKADLNDREVGGGLTRKRKA